MPKILCCLCSRRTDAEKQRFRVGTNSNWEMLEVHVALNGLNLEAFSKEDYVCKKCHALISHHRMKDRGSNKMIKNVDPITYAPGITKNVLRSAKSSSEATESQTSEQLETALAITHQTSAEANLSTIPVDLNVSKKSRKPKTSSRDSCSVVVTGELSSLYLRTETRSTDAIEADAIEADAIEADAFDNEAMSGGLDFDKEIVESSSAFIDIRQDLDTRQEQLVDNASESSITIVDKTTTELNTLTDPPMPGNAQEPEQLIANSRSTSVGNTLHLQGAKATQSRCFVCQSKAGRKAIPWPAIQQAWFELRCYVPKTNRTCDEHLTDSHTFDDESLRMIKASKQDIDVDTKEFELWIYAVSNLPKSTPYNFEEDGIEADKYRMFLGIERASFDDLLQYLNGMRNISTRSLRSALAMFLLLLRNNMKQELIAHNFSTTQQVVSKTIDAVSTTVDEHFVPKYLGYYHITREEALEKHSIQLTSKVLGQPESRLCLIADGTYNYIEKPSDFELQRKTFSAHKKRNLLKPLYIVFPDGYIMEAAGPYFCDSKNNDAANIRHHYKNSDLLLFLEEDDFFLLDRGYRDVVEETEKKGFSVFMPSLLTGKRTNFDCNEANSSRLVTMSRWVVEAVNGRIKNVFPFFKHTIEGTYVPKIMRFNRIACAIMNAYFPPISTNKDFHNIISEVCASDIPRTNEFKGEIEKLGLKRMTTRWERASASSVAGFPKLSMEDLKRITLGSYQIKIAERYIESHLKEDSDFCIFIHREKEGIIRARIQSRFSRSKTHDLWVKFDEKEIGYEAVKGLYCTCKVGERTLGCCSHLTSVLRYLGFDRHQPQKDRRRTHFAWDAIDCNDLSGDDSDKD